jgi:predicted murein hydrolase (TIGR00659 family)
MIFFIGLPLTIGLYFFCKIIQQRLGLIWFNPILITIVLLISLLYQLKLPYTEYNRSTFMLTWLLEPAIVALALPLYKEFVAVKNNIKPIASASLIALTCSMTCSVLIASALNLSFEIQASLATNAVTTPIALSVSNSIGGIPALAAVIVILVGIFGALCAEPFLRFIGVNNPKAQGFAMGAACHAIGTARALELHPSMGGFASIAMALSAINTAILVPILYPLLQQLLAFISVY